MRVAPGRDGKGGERMDLSGTQEPPAESLAPPPPPQSAVLGYHPGPARPPADGPPDARQSVVNFLTGLLLLVCTFVGLFLLAALVGLVARAL